MEVVPLVVHSSEEVEGAFASIRKDRIQGLLVLGDPMFGTLRKIIVEHATKGRIPNMFSSSEGPESGALMSYGTSFAELFRRAATYVDKILKGANPADLPIEQPTTFELVVNLKAARRLGLTIPASLLARADRVIE
jgi:putative ABC transport system substrate-binding protein